MLTAIRSAAPRFGLRLAAQLTVNINGHDFPAKTGESVLQVADRNGIHIPRLCYHPCLALQGSCGVCAVETTNKAGKTSVANACVTKVAAGLKVTTQSPKSVAAAKKQLQSLIDVHDERCSTCVANARCEFRPLVFAAQIANTKRSPPIPNSIDLSTAAVQIDPSKCVACARCVRACKNISGQKALKVAAKAGRRVVQATAARLSASACVRCGQCTLYCPVGAITEQSQASSVLSALRKRDRKLYVAQFDSSVAPSLADAFGVPVSPRQIVAALRAVGFDVVLDTAVAAPAAAAAAAQEFLAGVAGDKIYFTSTCPAFVNYVEKSRPDLIPQLSTVRTPSAVLAGVARASLAKAKGVEPGEVYVVSVGGCLAKKEEAARKQLAGVTDVALTARELLAIIRFAGINVYGIAGEDFDAPFGAGGAGFAASGAAIAAVLAKAGAQAATLQKLGGAAAQKVVSVKFGAAGVKAVAIQGLADGVKFLDKLKKKDPSVAGVKIVEILACPGGCVAGGGSVKPESKAALQERIAAVQKITGAATGLVDVSADLLRTAFAKQARK